MQKQTVTQLKAILFDLDGTLVDTAPDFVHAGNILRQAHNLPPLAAEQITMQVSNGAAAVTQRCMEISAEATEFEPLRQQLLTHYEQCLGNTSLVYPGLNQFLQGLSEYAIPWGIVTNKPYRYAEPLIQKLGLSTSCATLICPDHVNNKKPDPESLLLAADKISLSSEQIIYVGDHQRDIDAGKAAGMYTIAAAYGYILEGDSARNWGANHLVHKSQELVTLLASLLHIQDRIPTS